MISQHFSESHAIGASQDNYANQISTANHVFNENQIDIVSQGLDEILPGITNQIFDENHMITVSHFAPEPQLCSAVIL